MLNILYLFVFTLSINVNAMNRQDLPFPLPDACYDLSLRDMNASFLFSIESIEKYLNNKHKKYYLAAIKKRIQNHEIPENLQKPGCALTQFFFTYLLEHSPKFAKEITQSVCSNIQNMVGQNLANSFKIFKICLYDDSMGLETFNTRYNSKEDVLKTITSCLTLIVQAIKDSAQTSSIWFTYNHFHEFQRLEKLLAKCKSLQQLELTQNVIA